MIKKISKIIVLSCFFIYNDLIDVLLELIKSHAQYGWTSQNGVESWYDRLIVERVVSKDVSTPLFGGRTAVLRERLEGSQTENEIVEREQTLVGQIERVEVVEDRHLVELAGLFEQSRGHFGEQDLEFVHAQRFARKRVLKEQIK